MTHWLLPATTAFICWGIWAFLPKLTTRYIDPKSAIIYEAAGGLVVALVVLALFVFKPATEPRGMVLALSTGVLGAMGAFAYLYAMTKGPVVLVFHGYGLVSDRRRGSGLFFLERVGYSQASDRDRTRSDRDGIG
ncbi:MAG: hypothetical protein LOY00_13450 [Methylocaldum sp.]|nr:hypothetical protein [Methylocaldum sp.]